MTNKNTSCRCGLPLEYPEEKFCDICWCCAAIRRQDIGARYYYSTGIWSKPHNRKYKKPFNKRKENVK